MITTYPGGGESDKTVNKYGIANAHAYSVMSAFYIKLSDKTIMVSDGYIFVTLRSLFYDSLKNNDILIDDFSKFEIEDDVYCEGIDYSELSKDLTWYERTMFELSTLHGQRELSRQTGIHIQTIHRINKMVKIKLIKVL